MEKKIKHLELIENVIERMARNSFQLKGWAMSLVALVGALASKDEDKRFIVIAFIPIFVFWLLDSTYLQRERQFNALYREVTEKSEEEIDFNLNTRKVAYTKEEAKRIRFIRCMFSFSEFLFYGALCAAFLILLIVLKVL